MIGAMPAVSVRRDQKKRDGSIGYFSRPHKLSLHFRPPLTHHQVTPSPSPINSPPGTALRESRPHRLARLCANKRFIFQLSVLAPLVGTIMLFVGLIQHFVPGAEGRPWGLPLVIVGAAVLTLGLTIILIRFICKWTVDKGQMSHDLPQIRVNDASCTDLDIDKAENAKSAPATSAGGVDSQEVRVLINGPPDP